MCFCTEQEIVQKWIINVTEVSGPKVGMDPKKGKHLVIDFFKILTSV